MATPELTEAQQVENMIDRVLGPRTVGPRIFTAEQHAPASGTKLANAAQAERDHLQRLIDAAHPSKDRPAPRAVNQVSVQQYNPGDMEAQIARVANSPRVVTGPKQDGSYGVPGEAELLTRIQHVLRPGEKVMEFFARTGLSRHQIFTLTPEEISSFVAATAEHEVVVP